MAFLKPTSSVNLAAKADKVPSAVEDNLAAFDGDGNIKDAGVASDDFAATAHSHNDLYYTEAEADALLAAKSNTGHAHVESDVTNLVADLAAKATTASLTAHTSNTSNPHSVTHTQVDSSGANWNANKLQGRALASTLPTDGQAVVWDDAGAIWKPGTVTTDTSGKADKVSGAVENNLAALDATGNLTDSTFAPADFDIAGSAASVGSDLDAHEALTSTAHGGIVPSARTISTTAPLTGGGDLSANRTLAIDNATTSATGAMTGNDKAALLQVNYQCSLGGF